jgi:hypothetical protein
MRAWVLGIAWSFVAFAEGAAASEPPQVPPVESSMRGHFEKATTAMLAAALGELQAARDASAQLAATPGVPPNLASAARVVEKCGRVRCATEAVAEMGRACAECHLDTGHGPHPRPLTALPGETPREKHIYAATFAWVGLVAPKEALFLFGLANVVPPVDKTGGTRALGEAREAFRASQQAAAGASSLEERAAAFADLLDACAGCHAAMGVPAQ